MKSISFLAQISGDGECFHWGQIPTKDMQNILGEQQYAENLRLEQEFHVETGCPAQDINVLYPGDIWHVLGCEPGKKYRFTLQVEEV